MTENIRLCEPANALDADVIRLYEGAFPAAEREPVERLSALLAEGKLLYHRTLNEQGELMCFTFVSLAPDFSFLAYMATDPARRSGGIGSKHLQALVARLKEQFPQHIGMFFEIEATQPKAEILSDEELRNRKRRRAFYERAGARVLCEDGVYLTPHFGERNKEWEGELMAFEFGEGMCQRKLEFVISEIYRRFYQLPEDHPLVRKVLGYFQGCAEGCGDSAAQEAPSQAETGTTRDTTSTSLWRRLLTWLQSLLRRAF
jgi:GNAT superfamily N-acetyltransferase